MDNEKFLHSKELEDVALEDLGLSIPKKKLDVLCVGRAGVDLYVPIDAGLEETETLHKSLGGSAANVAVGLARLECKAALLTRVAKDALGRGLRLFLEKAGVDCSYLVYDDDSRSRSSLAILETNENPEVVFYRNHASDLNMQEKDISEEALDTIGLISLTGTALSKEPSRSAVFKLCDLAKKLGILLCIDIDYRPYTWESQQMAADVCFQAAAISDIVIANSEETSLLYQADLCRKGIQAAATRERNTKQESVIERELSEYLLSEANSDVKLYLAKRGKAGVLIAGKRKKVEENASAKSTGLFFQEQEAFRVQALKPYGAGDAFLSAFLAGLLRGKAIGLSVTMGQASAALVVSREGCASAMPNEEAILSFIAEKRKL